jgi:hypothetical protein
MYGRGQLKSEALVESMGTRERSLKIAESLLTIGTFQNWIEQSRANPLPLVRRINPDDR